MENLSEGELISLSALITAQAAEVYAANMDRESRGESMAYDGFYCEAWTVLESELQRRGILKPGKA